MDEFEEKAKNIEIPSWYVKGVCLYFTYENEYCVIDPESINTTAEIFECLSHELEDALYEIGVYDMFYAGMLDEYKEFFMDRDKLEVLEGIIVYARLLDNVNNKFIELIRENIEKEMYENEQLFYEIISEIMRILPVKKERGKDRELDKDSGILLLCSKIPFLEKEYQNIIDNKDYLKIIENMVYVRNKFTHEPHNMHATSYVGTKTSCAISVYHKDKLCSMSTIKISYIVYELNKIFMKLKNYVVDEINPYGEKYKDYPCIKALLDCDFEKYNEEYPMMPIWMLNDEEEVDWQELLKGSFDDSIDEK